MLCFAMCHSQDLLLFIQNCFRTFRQMQTPHFKLPYWSTIDRWSLFFNFEQQCMYMDGPKPSLFYLLRRIYYSTGAQLGIWNHVMKALIYFDNRYTILDHHHAWWSLDLTLDISSPFMKAFYLLFLERRNF